MSVTNGPELLWMEQYAGGHNEIDIILSAHKIIWADKQ